MEGVSCHLYANFSNMFCYYRDLETQILQAMLEVFSSDPLVLCRIIFDWLVTKESNGFKDTSRQE